MRHAEYNDCESPRRFFFFEISPDHVHDAVALQIKFQIAVELCDTWKTPTGHLHSPRKNQSSPLGGNSCRRTGALRACISSYRVLKVLSPGPCQNLIVLSFRFPSSGFVELTNQSVQEGVEPDTGLAEGSVRILHLFMACFPKCRRSQS